MQRNPVRLATNTEVHNQKLGTGIQQIGTSRTPNEVSLTMPAIRFDVAIYGDISRVTVGHNTGKLYVYSITHFYSVRTCAVRCI